jgi:preprotein translocase subunit YajC
MGIISAAQAASKSNSSLTILIPLVLLFIGIYFLVFRPQRRRQQAATQQQNTLGPGARIRTIGGMYADVVAVDGDDLILEVAPGVEVRYHKRAVAQVLSSGEEPEEEEPVDSEYDAEDAAAEGLGQSDTEPAEDDLTDAHEDDLEDELEETPEDNPADSHQDNLASSNGTKAKSDTDVF